MSTSSLELRLKAFRLPSFIAYYAELAERGSKDGWDYIRYLDELAALDQSFAENVRLVTVVGWGGQGKTRLVQRYLSIASDPPKSKRFF